MPGVLISIQESVAATLSADEYFSVGPPPISVIPEYKGDIENAINLAIAQIGLCLVVATPTAGVSREKANLPGPYLDPIQLLVIAFENVVINQGQSGPRALDALEVALNILHRHVEPGIHEAIVADEECFTPIQRGNRLGTAIRLWTRGGISRTREQNAPVSIADNGSGTITLSTAQSGGGGAIFYTTNGTEPTPTNALHYTGPFVIGPGVTVKARIWLAGRLPSVLATYTSA